MVVVGLTMAACGGDDDDDAGSGATTVAAAGAETTAAEATATSAAEDTATTAAEDTATTAAEDTATTAGGEHRDDSRRGGRRPRVDRRRHRGRGGHRLLEPGARCPRTQLATNFEAKYPGIDVEIVRGIDSDLAPKVEAENQTGQGIADFYVNASLSWVQDHADQGWFLPVEGPELTGQGAYDAEQFVHEGNFFEVGSAVLTFAWNTELYSARHHRVPGRPRPGAVRASSV